MHETSADEEPHGSRSKTDGDEGFIQVYFGRLVSHLSILPRRRARKACPPS